MAFEFTPQLQQQQRRLPDRPERAAGRRQIRNRHRPPAPATTPTSPARAPAPGTTTRSCSTPPRPPAPADHPLRRRQAVAYTKAATRHRRRHLRQRDPQLHVASRQRAVRRGDLDEVAIYNRALSAAQIAEHDQSFGTNRRRSPPSPPPPPVAHRRPGEPQRARLQRPGRLDRQIRMGPRRQRDLRDQHRLDPDRPRRTYANGEIHEVGLRVTDNLTGDRHHDPHDQSRRHSRRPPPSRATPNPAVGRRLGPLRRQRLHRSRRHDRQIRVGPRRQRQLRDQHRHDRRRRPRLRARRAPSTSACASPTTAAATATTTCR